MAKLVYGLQQSLDGYVDHLEMRPDEDLPDWDAEELDFAAAWRSHPKWVVSRSLKSVGPNATLVQNDVGTVLGELKARLVGDIDVAGPRPPLRLLASDRICEDVIRLTYAPQIKQVHVRPSIR